MPRNLGPVEKPPVVTSDPGSATAGDLWYRSDRGNFGTVAHDAFVEVPASPYLWTPGSNVWYKASQAGTVSASTPTASTMWLLPLWPNRRMTIKQIAFEISTQGVSASGTDVIRFGIYSADLTTGAPSGAPVVDWGTSDLEAAAGIVVFNVADQALSPRLYYLASARQTTGSIGVAGQVRMQVGMQQNHALMGQTASTPVIGTDGATFGMWTMTGVTGALPTISAPAASSAACPVVLMQIA